MPSREEVMDFTYPFYTEYTGGLYKKPNTDDKVIETTVNSFKCFQLRIIF